MTAPTIFLSRLIGIVAMIAGASMLIDRQPLLGAIGALSRDPAMLFVVGLLGIVAGVAIVLVHNIWSRGLWPLIVTLFGWFLLLRGIVVVLLPAELITQLIGTMHIAELYYLYAMIPLVLGAYLCLRGFTAMASPPAVAAAPAPSAKPPAAGGGRSRRRR